MTHVKKPLKTGRTPQEDREGKPVAGAPRLVPSYSAGRSDLIRFNRSTLGNHKKQTTDARHTQTHTHMHRHRHTRMHTQMHTDTRVHRSTQTHTRRTGNALRPRCLTVGAEAGPAGPAAPGRHQVAGVRPRGTLGLFSPEGWRSGRPVYNARWPQELHRKLGAAEREADTLGGQGRLPGK